MNTRLVKPVKHDLSSRSSVFTPVSPISKLEILSGKYLGKFYRIPPDSGILPDTAGIRIRYNPTVFLLLDNFLVLGGCAQFVQSGAGWNFPPLPAIGRIQDYYTYYQYLFP